jgi:hypothetical protein
VKANWSRARIVVSKPRNIADAPARVPWLDVNAGP